MTTPTTLPPTTNHHHHECSAQGQVFHCKLITRVAVLPTGRSSTANTITKVAVLLGMNRCDSFPLISAPHFLFGIWTDFKSSEKIPGTPTWRWGEWIWLTGPSRLHQNSPIGQVFTTDTAVPPPIGHYIQQVGPNTILKVCHKGNTNL